MAISHWSGGGCGCSWETIAAVNAAAAQLLRPAMQLAATSSSVTATVLTLSREAATSVAGQDRQQLQQQQPGLRLDSFSSDAVWAVALLDVLPAASMTCLKVDLDGSRQWHNEREHDKAALAAAVSRLTNLRQLQFEGSTCGGLGNCLPVIAQLSKLTCLTVNGDTVDDGCERALQQLLAQPLPLRELHIDVFDQQELPVLDLGRLQQLQEFTTSRLLPQGSVLPTQLRRLQLGECQPSLHLAAVMPLQQLTALKI
jgi:hypothetical protein